MKRIFILLLPFILVACGAQTQQVGQAPQAQNNGSVVPTPALAAPGQNGNYAPGYGVPQPMEVYIITGTVEAAPGSVQSFSIEGRSYGSSYNGYGHSSGYISGGTDGKGIVRLRVATIEWHNAYVEAGVLKRDEAWTPLAQPGDIVIIKVEDTRGTQFIAGDQLILLCREQWEFVGAVGVNEIPTLNNVSREFDLCRMRDGKVTPAPTPSS